MIHRLVTLFCILPTLMWAQPWTAQVTVTTDAGTTSYQHSGDKIGWEAVDHDVSANGHIRVLYGSGSVDTCEGAGRIWVTQGLVIDDVMSVGAEAWFEATGSGWEVPIRHDQEISYTSYENRDWQGDYVDRDGQITIHELICHGDHVELTVSYMGATELAEGKGPSVVGISATTTMTVPVIPQ